MPRYYGTADCSYKSLVRNITDDKRLSQKRKEKLIEDVDHLVGHMLDHFDFSLRNDYTGYYSSGAKYMKTKKRFGQQVEFLRELMMEAGIKALGTVSHIRRCFEKSGFKDRSQ